jgi:hypothetical protein
LDQRLDQRREPILNVPPVVAVLLAVLALVHAVRTWLLPDDVDRVVVWSLAFAMTQAR